MIDPLKDDYIVNKVGGRFKLTTLIQKRWFELLQGTRPAVKRTERMTDMETIIQEILDDKLSIDHENSDIPSPEELSK